MHIFNSPIPLSLYIHIPWCVRKCPYCDFNSHSAPQDLPEDRYVARLLADLDEQLPRIVGRNLVSIFFGGGTPSLFSPRAIEAILSHVHRRLHVSADTEITLEANPGTIDEARFKGFRAAGVNRLSIGIQSLQDNKLQALGRIHHRDHALRAITAAKNAGFDNFNVDLMHGLPTQTLEEALSDIQDALQFQPPHVSWYQLTIEPNTFFYHQPPVLPEEDVLWEIQEKGKQQIEAAQLYQYEVSAYAKANHECVHNKNYWEFGDYLGIGAGAHSKITHAAQHIITRHWQVKNPKEYLKPEQALTAQEVILTKEDIVFEFMLNALRLTQGVSTTLFTERTGLPLQVIEPLLETAKAKKLLTVEPSTACHTVLTQPAFSAESAILRPTELGQRFLNHLIELFLPAAQRQRNL